jgi:hypothetical protein
MTFERDHRIDFFNALTDDAFAMQVFTALVGAGVMALLGTWLDQ